jgi:biopolymer transport protein ExbD
MASVDTAAPRGHDKKKGKKKKKSRRLGVRLDMTPMVDVAFLLLTFFMLTTTMSRPQTMEINLPPDNKVSVDVPLSNLWTIRITENGSIYINNGIDDPKKIEWADFRKFMQTKLQENPKIITLIKVDRKGKYHHLVDIMDDLNVANVTRFSIAAMGDIDKKILAKVGA